MIKERNGDLVAAALAGEFYVIAHGCNCFCTQGKGLAKEMSRVFHTDQFRLEGEKFKGDINKLGNYECQYQKDTDLFVINAYTQYRYGTEQVHVDYNALSVVLRKINWQFKGLSIGLPRIGCGLAGGDWNYVYSIIQEEMNGMDVMIYSL